MRTELQRQASRLNGAKSRGPRTAAGKRRSSQNACRHGLYSRRTFSESGRQALALPMPPAPKFASLAEERYHLAHIASMQVAALETRILNDEMERQRALHPDESDENLLVRAFQYLCRETGVIEALDRLHSAASRRVEHAFCQLILEKRNAKLRSAIRIRETNPATPQVAGRPAASCASIPTRPGASPAAKTTFRETNPAASQPHLNQFVPLLAVAGLLIGVWLFWFIASHVIDGGTRELDRQILLSFRHPRRRRRLNSTDGRTEADRRPRPPNAATACSLHRRASTADMIS